MRDDYRSLVEMEVLPSQSQRLTFPHSGLLKQLEEGHVGWTFRGCFDYRSDLSGIRNEWEAVLDLVMRRLPVYLVELVESLDDFNPCDFGAVLEWLTSF